MQNKNRTTGQRIKTLGLGLLMLVGLALFGGFLYVPALFQAPYEGPTMTTEDGKELVTFVRLPEGEGPFPAIIVRSPYELPHAPLSGMEARDFTNIPADEVPYAGWMPVTEAGYALVIQHTRGRVGSEGLALDLNDREDSVELINWVKAQPWSNGKIGTTGDSIEAILAMLINSEYPEGVDASFVQNGSPNMVSGVMLEGGALKLETFLPWTAEQILTADDTHFIEMGYGPVRNRISRINMLLSIQQITSDLENPHTLPSWQHLPIKDYPHYSEALTAWNEILDTSPDSELAVYFDASETEVPSYYVVAWFDVFTTSQLSAFEQNEQNNANQRLLILNGTHYVPEDPGAWPIQPMLPWFDYHLKGETSALIDLPRVMFPIANGDDEWYGLETWPPPTASSEKWALTASGELTNLAADAVEDGTRTYAYDPSNPVPTVGGKNLVISHGTFDQQSVRQDQRADVLSYNSDPLDQEALVVGHVYSTLSVSSDAPDTDFTIKILDISPDGTSTLVLEAIQRARFREGMDQELFMQPGEVYEIDIDLGHIAWRFEPGHRIGVDVSSSNFPQWDRNLNTDQPLFSSTEMRIANNTIHHGAIQGSSIELPIISDISDFERMIGFETTTTIPAE